MKTSHWLEIGGPSIDAWPTTKGEKLRPGKGGGGGTSTTQQEIPAELKPLASAYTSKAIDLGNQGYQPFTGQRYADMNSIQGAGVGSIVNRAMNGSQTMNNAENALNQTIAGGNTNPYLDSMVKKAQDATSSNALTSMVNNGSFGNSGLLSQYGSKMGEIASSMYGNAYEADRGRQMQAIGMAPQFGNQAYQDASQLMNAGQFMQDQDQQKKDFGFQQYQDEQNLPYKQLAAMSGVFGSNLGGSSTTQQSGGGK